MDISCSKLKYKNLKVFLYIFLNILSYTDNITFQDGKVAFEFWKEGGLSGLTYDFDSPGGQRSK